jgi:DNA helicase-2/ATP-dependent DNA helicase PcrA
MNTEQLAKELNKEQFKAATTIEGPLLIIAGAGSGKTRTIIYRLAHMLEIGIPQSHMLALTFTNKAAREMSSRIHELTGKKLSMLTVSTFHSFGVKILRKSIGHLGYRENFSIYDQTDKVALIKEVSRELGHARDAHDFFAVANLFSDIKTGRTGWERGNEQYRDFYEEYQSHLKAYNAVDFDDLIILPITLFKEHPEVLEGYREKYRYITVDEFQDTSISQFEMVDLLASQHRNICVVGDDDQSIYSWRGANYENIITFETLYPERKEIKLEQNYRSTKTILLAANGLIANNTNRKIKELWTGVDGGRPIEIHYPRSETEEGDFISRTIKNLAVKEGLNYGDVGVLVRTNSLTRSLEESFLAENIPYHVSGGTSFFQRKEVKDITSYLRVMANPDDDVNLLRIINTPRRGIGKKTLLHLRDFAERRKMSLYSTVSALYHAEDSPLGEKTRTNLGEFFYLIEFYRNKFLSEKNLADTLRGMVDALGYWGWLVSEYQHNDKIARFKYRNITLFTEMLERWEKDPDTEDPNLYGFLNRITLITRDDIDDDSEKGKVNLMTIHAAKGLEFKLVFLAGVEDTIIPHARAVEEDPANIEEERRLFYVAITRAKEKLYMTSCGTRKYMNNYIECSPSPFLEEIPPGLIETCKEEEPVDEEEAARLFADLKARFS